MKMKRKKPVIALAQIQYFDMSTTNNVLKIIKYIKKAKKRGADIVCFPEACIRRRDTLELNDKLINRIRAECKKNSIWCIISDDIIIKKKSYNTSILINREGKIKGKYKKIHLYGDNNVKPGKRIMVFKTDFAKIGIVACWDIAFPELFKKMKEKGAEIVFCPAQWWYDSQANKEDHRQMEMKVLESLVLARAYENVYFVALCNPVMDTKFQVSYSAIASPTKLLRRIVNRQGLITAKINLNEIKKIEKIYKK